MNDDLRNLGGKPFERIRSVLADVRRELNRVSAREAALGVVAICGATAFIALSFALLVGPDFGRWGWVLVAGGLVLAAVAVRRLWIIPRDRRRSDELLAVWVEQQLGATDSSLVTAVQVGPMLAAATPSPGFSPQLAVEAGVRAARTAEHVRPKRLTNRRRLGQIALTTAGVVLLLGLTGAVAPDFYVEGGRRLVVGAEQGDDGERLVTVAVSQLALELVPPSYTGLSPRIIKRSVGDVEALRGTEVRFVTRALFPATSAALILESEPDARWPLELAGDGSVEGAFRIGQADRYQFALVDPDGRVIREKAWRHVDIREDLPPDLRLILPETDLEVKADDDVAFFFEGDDDYGLDRVDLVVVDDEGKERLRKLVAQPKGERTARGDHSVFVAELKLEPGDAVDVFFEAVDLNTITGPGQAKSASRRLSVYSPEAEHDRLMQVIEELIDAMIDVLADRLESPLADKDRFRLREYVAVGTKVATTMGRILQQMAELSARLSTDPLAGEALREGVLTVAGRLRDVHDQEVAQLERADTNRRINDAGVIVTLLFEINEEGVRELEQGALELKRLLDQARKDRILEAGRELLETQNEIMELLKKLKETKDPEALAEALEKLKKLQAKLAKLQRELAKLKERAPYENQNMAQRPSDRQREMRDMASTMDQIQKLLAEGKIDEAMELLEQLNKETQQMMAALQNDMESGSSMSAAGQRKAEELQTELDELADGQRGVQGETSKLNDEVAENAGQPSAEQLAAAKDKAQQIREKLEGIDGAPLHPDDQKALDGLKEDAKQLEGALGEGQTERAAGKAGGLSEGAGELGEEVGESAAHEDDAGRVDGLEKGQKALDEAAKQAGELAGELKEMMEGAGKPSGAQEGEMDRLGKRQGQLGDKLEQLGESLDELEGEMPGIKDSLQEPLDGAGRAMGEAQESLGKREGRAAEDKQSEAIEKLEEARQSLQEQMEQRSKQQGGEGQTGINNPKAKVAIPEDDGRPASFREELLKAMKERAPDEYREAIERFYEELIK